MNNGMLNSNSAAPDGNYNVPPATGSLLNRKLRRVISRFCRDEDGMITLFAVYMLLMILMITVINTEWFRRLGGRYPRWRNFLASAAPSGLGQVFVRE